MGKVLFTEKEVAFIEDETSVRHENRWNYRDTISKKVDESLRQFFDLFPQLVEYIDIDQIHERDDMADGGWALGQILTPEQRRELAAALVWADRRPDETDEAFLSRLPNLIGEFSGELKAVAGRVGRAEHEYRFLQRLSEMLQATFEDVIARRREEAVISMAVPIERVIRWAKDKGTTDEPPTVPDLLDALYRPWDDSVHDRSLACRDILISLGLQLDVDSVRADTDGSLEEKWALYNPPREEDIEQYLAVLAALDTKIEALVAEYLTTERVVEKDRLVAQALDLLDGLSKPERDLLKWDERRNSLDAWNGPHTRTANRWTDDRAVPLLRVTRASKDHREWKLTPFGEFVQALWENRVDQGSIETEGFPTEVPHEIVNEALSFMGSASVDDAL